MTTKEILCECKETLGSMKWSYLCTSLFVTGKLNRKLNKFTNKGVNTKPCWKERIEKEIYELREVSVFDEFNNRSKSEVKNT